MNKYLVVFLFLIVFLQSSTQLFATHIMGGEITWECDGNGDYIFQLNFYRDCNGFEVNTNAENIRVWNHTSVTSISLPFQERIDISPTCTSVNGNTPILCGTGAQGGNGPGAVEKVIYRSAPVSLGGIPPEEGWVFTYENFSRSGNLSNIQNPLTYGMTIRAIMFAVPGAQPGECIDNSPKFLQDPYVVSCTGEEYVYNPHGEDSDMDSLVFRWAEPLNDFIGEAYAPPVFPEIVPFETGYSFTNPTPDQSFNANNVPAQLDTETGEMSFTSFTQGDFATKIQVDAYRQGQRIATVERETQLVVQTCSGTNNAPDIIPPFAGSTSFETTVLAGDLVNFDLIVNDADFLQDGSAQTVTIEASGIQYGTNFTDPSSGCEEGPCATLTQTPPVSNPSSATLSFQWQTSCDHLLDATGNALNEIAYVFVFKIQDDYCPIPKVRYETVTVRVQNSDVLPSPTIECIQADENNDLNITFTPISGTQSGFVAYELHQIGQGIVATSTDVSTSSFSVPNASLSEEEFTIATVSGCNGNTKRYSDTISNVFLDLNNPGNGTALLQWNQPKTPPANEYAAYFQIYKEFPAGNWQWLDSVPYGVTFYRDTITVCEAFISYRIELPTASCSFISNVDGDTYEDNIVPDIPVILQASVDTLTGNVEVSWAENSQSDTYGYVVYTRDVNGFLVEIDTVWGITNTTFIHEVDASQGPLDYSVAAFDSCFTEVTPPTYQTSAKGEIHTTNHLIGQVDVCNRDILLQWTGYVGYDVLSDYEIWGRKNDSVWMFFGQTNQTNWTTNIDFGDEYVFVVLAKDSSSNNQAFSNTTVVSFEEGGGPTYSDLSLVSVENGVIEILHRLSLDGGVERIELWKFNEQEESFIQIDSKNVGTTEEIEFTDTDVDIDRNSYSYKTRLIDTCNQVISESVVGNSILLEVVTDETEMTHTLFWNNYADFIGNLVGYKVYRGFSGNFSGQPIAELIPSKRTFTDSLLFNSDLHNGKVCYRVEAIESDNEFGDRKVSKSNEVCPVLPPLVFIPNAFTVGGGNPVFKPETSMHQIVNYDFAILDRFGRTIFETDQPEIGWDGRILQSNEVAREGMYVYRLSIRNGNGIEIVRHGHVTLLDYR